MSEIQLFNVDDHSWRFGVTEEGVPYAVAADVARSLDYQRTSDAVKLLDDEESGTAICRIRSANGVEQNREMIVIYEDGIWELIFRSNKPEAKALKKRVKEILREIRETGSYGLQLTVPQTYAAALRAHADAVEAAEKAQKELEAAQPQLETYRSWLSSEAVEMTDFAKRINFTPVTKFTSVLRDLGVLRKDKTSTGRFRNLPTADWEGSFEVRPVQLPTGEWIDLALINTSGQLDIREVLADEGYSVE